MRKQIGLAIFNGSARWFLTLFNPQNISEGQPPIKRHPSKCRQLPSTLVNPEQVTLSSSDRWNKVPLKVSPCPSDNVEAGASPLGYSWWQVRPSDLAATHNALSQSQGPEGTMVLLSPEKLGCVWGALYAHCLYTCNCFTLNPNIFA